MQKPATRAHRQTAVGELSLVIPAKMIMIIITYYVTPMAMCVLINVCICACVYKEELIMGCLAVMKTIIILKQTIVLTVFMA